MKYFIGGVNGVGKSSFLDAVKKKHPEFECVRASALLMEVFGYGGDYEKLRATAEDEKDRKLAELMGLMFKKYKGQTVLLDAHYLNLIRGRVSKVTGPWLSGFDALVLITAPVRETFERISLEHDSRDRALFPDGAGEDEKLDIFSDYADLTHEEFLRLANHYHLPRKELVNKKGDLSVAVSDFLEFDRVVRKEKGEV